MSQILSQRGIQHSFSGHPSMSGLFFSEKPPRDYRDWASSDYTFYEALAPHLHDLGVLCEPDSREPWFVCEAHDDRCLGETLERFETAVNRVVSSGGGAAHAGRRDLRTRPDGLELGEIRRDRHRRGPQRPDQRRLSRALRAQGAGASSACPGSAARRSAARSRRAGCTRTARTSAACCGPSSSATSTSRGTACRSCPTAAASRSPRNGDILGNYTDEQVQRREFARHNPRDADAYHRYSTDVMRQCKFIRPLLLRSPPDPTSFKPRDIREMLFLGKRAQQVRRAVHLRHDALLLDEHRRLPQRVLRVRHHQGAPVGQRHHRLGAWASTRPARPTCCCTTTWATSTARSAPGASRAAAWARCRRRSRTSFKSFGGEIVTDAPVARVLVRGGTRHRRRDRERQRVPRRRRRLEPRPAAHLHQDLRPEGPAARVRREGEELQDPRLVRQAQHRARRAAGVPGARQGQPARLRRHAFPRFAREDGARLRRLEERHLVEGAVPRPADPVDDRPDDGAARASTSCRCSCSTCRRSSTAATGPTRTATGFKNTVLDQIGRYSPNFKSLVRHVEVPHAARAGETRSASPRATSSRAS